ncbi:Tfp pilus assembly protein, ATPase [Gottschalkia acidurici 9a]|uniref:Tfp pilus assembly protein, ATPase n=1 Tax=Gottschalkia acidurici (strain ATCC 7906 / DSM 604 / BCRC 14475 / CIP 104303 / KCTC 5404 / NCIMB 10678 / 9a) TaxID=1128398 RepID=K0AYF1_GOTA9|nr:pilus assembly protein PilM [Gottschalkia acidurici]AFS77802.1 Tfp pilus assembly protein, ATPase [Gottschalkia acidurici 9a]
MKSKMVKRNKLSIDIGSKNIKIVEGMCDGEDITIKSLIMIPTPENCYCDGQITNLEVMIEVINDTLQKKNISTKGVIYTIESNSIISREIELPSIIEKDIKKMLEFQVEEYFPVNIEEYIIQSKIVEQIDNNELKKSILYVYALPKTICEGYMNLTKKLGLKPIALDMNDNSIYKFLIALSALNTEEHSIKDKTIAVLDIGYSNTNVSIIENAIFRFSRLVEFGEKELDLNIEAFFNVSLEDSLGKLYAGVERIFRYYTSRSSVNTIDYIYIYGAISEINGIDKYIENIFSIHTLKLNKLNNIILDKNHTDLDISLYGNAIGALIRK